MHAHVEAVAELFIVDDNAQSGDTPGDSPPIDPDIEKKLETARNSNVMIGNWEVQNWYRQNSSNRGYFEDRFKFGFYLGAWNMYSDLNIHYKNGDLYRTEKITVRDDVELKDYSKTGSSRYSSGNVTFGGEGSSVHQTNAAINKINVEDYVYNAAGNPYIAADLDSIDIDFEPEVSFNKTITVKDKNGVIISSTTYYSIYPHMDWDLQLGYDYWGNRKAIGSGHPNVGVGTVNYTNTDTDKNEKAGWSDHLRIHSSINFDEAFFERARYEKNPLIPNDRDVLWTRIESEPMLNKPDAGNGYSDTNINSKQGMFALNSVRQIIISFNANNTGLNRRPYVIFYDGPERYSDFNDDILRKELFTTFDRDEYITQALTGEIPPNSLRNSMPVIVNLNANTNAILYMPNSPVVLLSDGKPIQGSGHLFNGFIVAKAYARLKDKEDFEKEVAKGTLKRTSRGYQSTVEVKNPYYGTQHGDYKRDNGEPPTIKWTYTKIVNPDNGIEMYVDDYGNVQYMEIEESRRIKKYGNYATFGKTDFTTHDYAVAEESEDNLILSTNSHLANH